jgi:hypothetical protein
MAEASYIFAYYMRGSGSVHPNSCSPYFALGPFALNLGTFTLIIIYMLDIKNKLYLMVYRITNKSLIAGKPDIS